MQCYVRVNSYVCLDGLCIILCERDRERERVEKLSLVLSHTKMTLIPYSAVLLSHHHYLHHLLVSRKISWLKIPSVKRNTRFLYKLFTGWLSITTANPRGGCESPLLLLPPPPHPFLLRLNCWVTTVLVLTSPVSTVLNYCELTCVQPRDWFRLVLFARVCVCTYRNQFQLSLVNRVVVTCEPGRSY